MKILVTGAAGFIGLHVARLLLERGDEIVGIDNLNDYYDPKLKLARLECLKPYTGFHFVRMDIADSTAMASLFAAEKFSRVIHLAAQAGVRYSLTNPHAYVQSNLVGFGNVLEGCRQNTVEHLVYASSSSVYGTNTRMPFSVHDEANHPISLYAATKKIKRTDGTQLQPPVRSPDDRPALLHGLWSVGASGHVAVVIHQCHSRRPLDRCFQPRQDAARFHLRW